MATFCIVLASARSAARSARSQSPPPPRRPPPPVLRDLLHRLEVQVEPRLLPSLEPPHRVVGDEPLPPRRDRVRPRPHQLLVLPRPDEQPPPPPLPPPPPPR